MKTKLLLVAFVAIFSSSNLFAQYSKVVVRVKWKDNSFDNKVEVYNSAHDLLLTLCDDAQCYTGTKLDSNEQYGARYDLGCVADGNNYYIKLYDYANNGWEVGGVTVEVAGTTVINDNGSGATNTGQTIYFNVGGGGATCSSEPDMDQDRIVDYLDYDDDGDGIPDGVENLGEDRFECTLPPLIFQNPSYQPGISTGAAGTVGAIYRFGNAIEGKDVLMEILELTSCTINNIDNDGVNTAANLQTEINFTGTGTPGARFKFTIVDSGTTTPSAEIYRINGITWDTDGTDVIQESVIYYDPSAYGIENPSDLEVFDLGGGDYEIRNTGKINVNGFSDKKWLRAYFQFLGNSFEMRMQTIKSNADSITRLFGMSFTQCEFLDFNANALVIVTGEDSDLDGKYNHLDLDSDNDGIPDNVEAQSTLGYIPPAGSVDRSSGIYTAYGAGLDPIDTDKDNTPDVLDTDTDADGLPDIEENGMANAIITFVDVDDDGLDALFEGAVASDPTDVNDEINSPEASILPDADGDVYTGGDLDYRDLFNTNPPSSATLDFDGIDDYVSTPKFIEGQSEVTMMGWVKIDPANAGKQVTLFGEDFSCRMYINGPNRPYFMIKTSSSATLAFAAGSSLPYDEWHHVAGTFSSITGNISVYVDGKLIESKDTGLTGTIEEYNASDGTFTIGRLSRKVADRQYFRGDIDEVRVFDTVLTPDQIQRMVYQEIQQNTGNVQGSVINKDVIDINTDMKVSWTNLVAYYPMTDIVSNRTLDFSNNNNHLFLYNIDTVMEQTAPMPYETKSNGAWDQTNTWLHGDVWDIENVSNNKNWSIVRVNSGNAITTNSSLTQLGMIVEDGGKLTVNGDKALTNNWYMELNGTLDLQGDSQLIQGVYSDLVTSANGKLLRRQDSNDNVYRYTYVSSPVGAQAATTLGDDNANTNNDKNTGFSLNLWQEGDGSPLQFTTANNETGKLSTRWTYTFLNGITYYDWDRLNPGTEIDPGVGFIHKGMGNGGATQEFLYEGRPNNGTILVAADDVDGDSANESEPDVTQTTTLVGNPYPSAIDAHAFIDDNVGVIDGTLYLWQQWAGDSHILDEYEGGYATLNKMAKIRAYQFEGISGGTTASQDGTLTPTQYIAVGQSFMTEVIADGNIEFNNGQRVFKRQSAGETTFFRANASESEAKSQEADSLKMIKLEYRTANGLVREMVVGFSAMTTMDYDYGYDAKLFSKKSEDMYTMWSGERMIAQAYPEISAGMEIPLVINTTGEHELEIRALELQGFEEQEVYLKDNLTQTYFDLRSDESYVFDSDAGEITDRFMIVFESGDTLTTETVELSGTLIYFNNTEDLLYIKGLNQKGKTITLTDMSGKTIYRFANLSVNQMERGLRITGISSGIYLVGLTTETDQVIHKKIIVN